MKLNAPNQLPHTADNSPAQPKKQQSSLAKKRRVPYLLILLLVASLSILLLRVSFLNTHSLAQIKPPQTDAYIPEPEQTDSAETTTPDVTQQIDISWQETFFVLITVNAENVNTDDVLHNNYSLYDCTGDGIPELFLQKYGNIEIYVFDQEAPRLLSVIPGYPYSICPLDTGNGFLAVKQFQFSETVLDYQYNDGDLTEVSVLTDAPVTRLQQNNDIPTTSLGYRDFSFLEQFSLTDNSGIAWSQNPVTDNQAIYSYIQAHQEELQSSTLSVLSQNGIYKNPYLGISCAYPQNFESSDASDSPWFLQRFCDSDNEQVLELYCQELDVSTTIEQALNACIARYPEMSVTYSANGNSWYAVSLESEGLYLYRKAFLTDDGSVLVWFDYYFHGDTLKSSVVSNIESIEESFSVQS